MSRPRVAGTRPPRAIALWLAIFAGVSLGACGSRGPLDIEIVQGTADDAGVDATPPLADAADDVATVDAAPVDAGHEASLVDCGTCLAQQCGQQILKCVQATTCRTTLQCAVQQCFAAGNTSPNCLLQCTNGNPAGLIPLIGIVTCVTNKCGADCTSVLGGLGGGGIGGGGGGRDGG
jgi:predicted small lipoprotein YifL